MYGGKGYREACHCSYFSCINNYSCLIKAVFENEQSNNAASGDESDEGGFMEGNRQRPARTRPFSASGSSIVSQHGRSAVQALGSTDERDVNSFRTGGDTHPPPRQEQPEEDPEERKSFI